MRIILDLDEVLCDFVGGVCARWMVDQDALLSHWPLGKWDIIPPLNLALLDKYGEGITVAEFWQDLAGEEEFWSHLKPLPWFDDLLQIVGRTTDDWHIVSSPSKCVGSYVGKTKWLKNRFGASFNRFAITPHKHLFANRDTVLIDDSDANVSRFVESGGRGIVFPRHHNSRHSMVNRPIEYIFDSLNSIEGTNNAPIRAQRQRCL